MVQEARRDTSAEGGGIYSPPSISLPKGGGATRGIGEKFAANPVNGTGATTVPLFTSPGRSGFGPQLSLSYDSGAGNGPFGFGWTLSLPSITRKTDKGLPQYRDADESDVYILSGAEDLVPGLNPDGSRSEDATTVPGYTIHPYRPRVEGLFARIERWTLRATGEIHWRSISRDNITTLYGRDNNSRVFDPLDATPATPTYIFSWLLCQSFDDKGNAIVYEYEVENEKDVDLGLANEQRRVREANRYLKRIWYGNQTPNRDANWAPTDASLINDWLFEVVFDYNESHYEDLALDPLRAEADQHRFVRAADASDGSWKNRPDPFSSHRSGFEVRTYRRCQRVLMFHRFDELGNEPCLVRSTELDYADLDYDQQFTIDDELTHQGSTRFASFIRSVTQSGFVRDPRPILVRNGIRYATYLKKSLPPLEFVYSKALIQDDIQELDADSLENLPIGLDGAIYQWADLDGEGVSGILTEQGDAWYYKRNLGGGRFGPLETVLTKPSMAALSGGRQQLLDLAGEGQLDLVDFAGTAAGFYERTNDESWEPFCAFRELPNVAWDDPNQRFVDLDGDGHADVLITEDDVFTWHLSLAEEGFGPARIVHKSQDEERGPRLVLADGTQSIYLADMCGDGLTDLVRVRNGEVAYWPNVGYGRFGPKITMDNSPWFASVDEFEQRRIRLADIDGSGTNDIIYLGRDGVRLYFNQSGNRWSEPRGLPHFPPVDNVSSITTTDFLGNGTACLVWSSSLPASVRRPIRYVDLMGGQKPHLLIGSVNNLGAETHLEYASSTKFYLADKAAKKPWVTRLPFPVHVVERVETYDRISRNRFVTRYAYHDGYFDGIEREFRGFGMVEEWDTEEFASLSASQVFPTGSNVDASSHIPPLLTKTWFHTGGYLDREHISNFFAGLIDASDTGEYHREPGLTDTQARELLLDDTVLPFGLTVEEEREACRALKGSMLRQEVYGLDGTEREGRPYTVSEQNFTIRLIQARQNNRHAVFFTHAREAIRYHYERALVPVLNGEIVGSATTLADPNVVDLPDPRTDHSVTLEVDDFGNVLKSASVNYGRRFADLRLPTQEDRNQQARTLITYAENAFTNPVVGADDYRCPVPSESCTFELTGLTAPASRSRFTLAQVLDGAATAATLAYEGAPTAGRLEKRLIEDVRSLYRSNDLTGVLARGQVESMALPFESQKLAFTPGLVTKIYAGRVTDAMLSDECGYVHSGADTNWWIPSGQVFYSPETADTAVQELTYARGHFFLPHRYRDPFHTNESPTETFVSWDRYNLLVEETCDALTNRHTVGERAPDPKRPLAMAGQDYRVLQAARVMDSNRNRTIAVFDALGMVAGTAVMGKPEDNPVPGDRLAATFTPDLTQAEIDLFFASPKGAVAATLLDEASTRIIYDVTRYWREPNPLIKGPAFAVALARETHASQPVPAGGLKLQVTFSYSDGFGREIQKKAQAEMGPVPERDDAGAIITGADGQPEMTSGDVSPRWVGSGWTVFNNKGKPVRQYEPFFTDTHDFEFEFRIGVSPVLFYDPVERVIATLHPNHTWEKIVFDAWRKETWDVADTVLVIDPKADPDVGDMVGRLPNADYLPTWYVQRQGGALGQQELAAARKAEVFARTPSAAHFDPLGRAFLTIGHNRYKYSDTPSADPATEEFYSTRVYFDIEGNQREIADAKDRVVMIYDYDMLGDRTHQASMEAGDRWMLNDVAAKQAYSWDSVPRRIHTHYDQLRRATDALLSEAGGQELLIGRNVYGESRPFPEDDNLREKVVEIYDQAGAITTDEYDFKGNQLRSQRQLAQRYSTTLNWYDPLPREGKTYTSRTRYDALNRPIQLIAPHSDEPGAQINVIQPDYNVARLLERIDSWLGLNAQPADLLDPTTADLHAITNIDYDAKGQRTLIDYGNKVSTTYEYDPLTFRLVTLITRRGATDFPDDCPPSPRAGWPGCQVQNLHYTYDPVGNISYIRDDAQQTIYFRNRRVEPSAEYTYDAVYRLIEATGREHLGQGAAPVAHSYNDVPRIGIDWSANDGNAMGKYLERYTYDASGNILDMEHRGDAGIPGWNRAYSYNESSLLEPGETSNRLTSTTIGSTTETYSNGGDGYDSHGNMLYMPHLSVMQWDLRDQLQMTQRQAVNPGDADGAAHSGERTWYVYDSAGQRVRKVTEVAPDQIKDERVYLGGFEIYRKPGFNPLVRETLHIMDAKQRIALVETRTTGYEPGLPTPMIRFQFRNHLGSACLELDDRAKIISYEEYTAYGSTTYQAVRSQAETSKRFRYSGKERDDENGFYYQVARYYPPWLARWITCDPAGPTDSYDLYIYNANSPVVRVDDTGTESDPFADTNRIGAYSPELQVIWLKEEDYKRLGSLKDEQKLTLVHEMAHAAQDLTILKKYASRDERGNAVKQEARAKVQTMSKEEFAKADFQREMQAEEVAQKVGVEAIDSFEKSQQGKGFPKEFLQEVVTNRMKEFSTEARDWYLKKAEAKYEHILTQIKIDTPRKSGSPASKAPKVDETKDKINVRFLPLDKIEGALFKPGESKTFDDLFASLKGLNVQFAIYDESAKKQLKPEKDVIKK